MTLGSRQTPDPAELKGFLEWITMRMAVGMPCDNCSLPLVAGEESKVAKAMTDLGILLFVVCERCSRAEGGPNVNSRLVTNETVEFLMSHVNKRGR